MGRCAKRILNTKELSEGAFHRVAARSTHSGYTGKKESGKPLGDQSRKSPSIRTQLSPLGSTVKPPMRHSAPISTSSSHVCHGHSDRAPDVACSFYVAAHLSRRSSSPLYPSHTAKHLSSTAHPYTHSDPRRTEQKSYRFIITTVTCPHFCL